MRFELAPPLNWNSTLVLMPWGIGPHRNAPGPSYTADQMEFFGTPFQQPPDDLYVFEGCMLVSLEQTEVSVFRNGKWEDLKDHETALKEARKGFRPIPDMDARELLFQLFRDEEKKLAHGTYEVSARMAVAFTNMARSFWYARGFPEEIEEDDKVFNEARELLKACVEGEGFVVNRMHKAVERLGHDISQLNLEIMARALQAPCSIGCAYGLLELWQKGLNEDVEWDLY